ncbi:MAG: phage tail protein [Deltaproteobacteria bacterium]|nr:phage tail protein [Deltaproteobacteria bacterium]
MAEHELPALVVESVAATVETARPLLINRAPAPDETDVPINATVVLEFVDSGSAGIDLAATRVWIDAALAFDGSPTPAFAGGRAAVDQTPDALRLVLDPVVPFASLATVTVRVVSNLVLGGFLLDLAYSFQVEDRTAPKLLAAIAISQTVVRLGFDEPAVVSDTAGFSFAALGAPAVPVAPESAAAIETLVDVTLSTEMTPDVTYRVIATGVRDRKGNPVLAPFDTAVFHGFRPARHPRRRFDLWSMLPKHNRRSDTTGDLARFIACLQEVVDLLLVEVDRFPDLWDIERAPSPFLDLILRDLGNPFPFDLDELSKRRLATVLVEMYRQKGTAIGIRNAVRFFLGIDIQAITGLASTALVLGESELGVDWELGPSDRFARYAFDVKVGRVLTPTERKHLRAIVNYMKPAHTHFVNLIEPLPPIVPDHWELGASEVGETTFLH